MSKINWTALAVFDIVALLVFLVGVSLLSGWGYGGWGWMGPGMMGPRMMGGWGSSPFGWLGMIFMWLIPMSFFVLIILGIVWLVRSVGRSAPARTSAQPCSNCGKKLQSDWRNCPYCGAVVK